MAESYDHLAGSEQSADSHPANNISHLPEDSPADGSAFEAAAERTVRSVKSPREPGPITKTLFALGASPLIMGHIVNNVARGGK